MRCTPPPITAALVLGRPRLQAMMRLREDRQFTRIAREDNSAAVLDWLRGDQEGDR